MPKFTMFSKNNEKNLEVLSVEVFPLLKRIYL